MADDEAKDQYRYKRFYNVDEPNQRYESRSSPPRNYSNQQQLNSNQSEEEKKLIKK